MASPDQGRLADDEEAIGEQAADWFARMASERVLESECNEFRDWRAASPAHEAAYDGIAAAWEASGRFADAPSILEMRVAALAEAPDRSSAWRFAAIAAAIALVLATTLTVSLGNSGWFAGDSTPREATRLAERTVGGDSLGAMESDRVKESGERAEEAELAFNAAYSTRIGEMAEFALPDGSSIALNTGSEVRVDFSTGMRELILVRGEAMFTVAKDADRPFTVSSGRYRVVALGTVFAVRRTGEEAQVTLIEGRVRVERDDPSSPPVSAKLVAGEQLRILANRSFTISRAEVARATSWRDGRLVFDQTPLREVLEEFNRYSNEKHVLRDEGLGDFLVNGTFRIKSSEHFAATLEAGFPVVVRARSGGKVLEVYSAQDLDSRLAD